MLYFLVVVVHLHYLLSLYLSVKIPLYEDDFMCLVRCLFLLAGCCWWPSSSSPSSFLFFLYVLLDITYENEGFSLHVLQKAIFQNISWSVGSNNSLNISAEQEMPMKNRKQIQNKLRWVGICFTVALDIPHFLFCLFGCLSMNSSALNFQECIFPANNRQNSLNMPVFSEIQKCFFFLFFLFSMKSETKQTQWERRMNDADRIHK